MNRVHAINQGKVCLADDCSSPAISREMCSAHYQRWLRVARREGLVGRATDRIYCEQPDCGRPHVARGFCSRHYAMWSQGMELTPIRTPTGRTVGEYIRVLDRDHPNSTKRGWMFEHVRVMSQMLGRPLLPHENVHHKNGNKHDNRPENLELWSTSQPSGQRVEDKLEWARSIIELYGP